MNDVQLVTFTYGGVAFYRYATGRLDKGGVAAEAGAVLDMLKDRFAGPFAYRVELIGYQLATSGATDIANAAGSAFDSDGWQPAAWLEGRES